MEGDRQAKAATTSAATTSATSTAGGAGTGNDARLSDAEAAKAIADAEYDLRFELLYLEHYHSDRAAFLKRANKAGAFVTALSGTTAVGGAFASPIVSAVSGFVTALISTAELVLDLAGSSRRHEARVERVRALQAELACCERSLPGVAAIDARRLALEPVEPGSFHAVAALAWNAAYRRLSIKPDPNAMQAVPPRDCHLRHIRRFTPERFRALEERAGGAHGRAPV